MRIQRTGSPPDQHGTDCGQATLHARQRCSNNLPESADTGRRSCDRIDASSSMPRRYRSVEHPPSFGSRAAVACHGSRPLTVAHAPGKARPARRWLAPAAWRVIHVRVCRETLMASFDLVRILLLVFSVAFGLLVGVLTIHVPAFYRARNASISLARGRAFCLRDVGGIASERAPCLAPDHALRAGGLALSFLCCYAAIALCRE